MSSKSLELPPQEDSLVSLYQCLLPAGEDHLTSMKPLKKMSKLHGENRLPLYLIVEAEIAAKCTFTEDMRDQIELMKINGLQ